MNNKYRNLISRGYIEKEIENKYINLSIDAQIKLLQNKIPTNRTIGARLLNKNNLSIKINYNKIIELLIEQLKIEKKLYPKIEISNSLISFGKLSVKPLINILGKIGNNQHKKVPEKKFLKNNYPLPRDIASRTLSRMGSNALSELVEAIKTIDTEQLSEAIEAIGFICFYDYQPNIFEKLVKCYHQNATNNLIKWKIIRAMSGLFESKLFLQEQKNTTQNKRIISEIDRSLLLIKKRN